MDNDLMLPNGRKVSEEPHLASVLASLDVPGADHGKGRVENIQAYEAHLNSIGKAAYDAAINSYLTSKSNMLKKHDKDVLARRTVVRPEPLVADKLPATVTLPVTDTIANPAADRRQGGKATPIA